MLYSPKGQKDQKGGPDRIEMFLEFPRRKKESNRRESATRKISQRARVCQKPRELKIIINKGREIKQTASRQKPVGDAVGESSVGSMGPVARGPDGPHSKPLSH